MTFRWLKLWSFRVGADFGDCCQGPYRNRPARRSGVGYRKALARRVR